MTTETSWHYYENIDRDVGAVRYDLFQMVQQGGDEDRHPTTSYPVSFSTYDPCRMADKINALSQDGEEIALTLKDEGVLARLYHRCQTRVMKHRPKRPPDLPEPKETPPVGDDTPELQGLPWFPPDVKFQEGKKYPIPMGGAGAAGEVFDREHPLGTGELGGELAGGGFSMEQTDEFVSRVLRNEPFPEWPHPTHSDETTRYPVDGGDPTDLFRGTLSIGETDLEVPTAVLPLRLVRSYRSGRPYHGPWGFGWDHTYNVYVRELRDDGVAHWTGTLHEDVYTWGGSTFESRRGVHNRLERLPGVPHGYVVVRPGGSRLRFERPPLWTEPERIPLVEIRDRHGNAQVLTYNAGNRLLRVEDDDGRFLEFDYDGCGLLRAVRDHAGRQVSYEVDGEYEHLRRVTFPATETYPDGPAVCYEYDDRADHPAMRHNLLRVVDPEGRTYLHNEYSGPEAEWSFNRVTRQFYGGHAYELGYEQVQYVPPDPAYVSYPAMRATVRPPDGSLHVYTFNYRGDLLDHRFRLNSDRSFRVLVSTWEYDEKGNVTRETRPDGSRTEFTYDSTSPNPCDHGNLLKVEVFAAAPFAAPSRVIYRATYDPDYQLPVETKDEIGSTVRYVYDFDTAPGPAATGRLERMDLPDATLPDGTVQIASAFFETNTRNQTTAVVSPEGIRDETEYHSSGEAKGFVERVISGAGAVDFAVRHEYDPVGFPRRTIAPGGRITEVFHDPAGRIREIVLPAVAGSTASLRYRYDHLGNPVRRERPRGTYDDAVIEDDFLADEAQYDVLGHAVVESIGANTGSVRTWEVCRDHEGRAVVENGPDGLRIERCFDERGLLLKETFGARTELALSRTMSYDRAGRVLRVTEPDGRTTRFEYDPWGRPSRTILPNGSVERSIWGPGDLRLEVSVEGDPGDGSTRALARRRFEYDERGRVIREIESSFRDDPNAAVDLVTEYHYDNDDRLVRQVTPRGGTIESRYDALNRLAESTDVHGNVDEWSYGPIGQLERRTRTDVEPGGSRSVTWLPRYDGRGRLESLTEPGGKTTEFVHDARDLLVERREPLDVVTRIEYGLLGEVRGARTDATGIDAAHVFSHDAAGRITGYTDPTGETTLWSRDGLGRVRETQLPDGAAWQFVYDGNGRLQAEVTPSGSHFAHEYDPATGRLARISCNPAPGVLSVPPIDFEYDGMDRIVTASQPGHAVLRKYDGRGRLIEESAQGRTTAFRFDDHAGTSELVYPDGRRERTETDVGGRATRVLQVATGTLPSTAESVMAQLSYSGPGRLHSVSYGTGVETSFLYDDRLRLTRMEHRLGSAVFQSVAYLYDERDRHRLTQEAGGGLHTRLHGFDGLDRLVDARWDLPHAPLPFVSTQAEHDAAIAAAQADAGNASVRESYQLDAADSRTERTVFDASGITVTPYTRQAGHQLQSAGSETFTHHADGPRASDGARNYEIDALGRLVRVHDAGGTVLLVEFEYDPLSRVALRTDGGTTRRRWYVGDAWVHEEDQTQAPTRQRTPHPAWMVPLVERDATGIVVPHSDGGFSVLGATDGTGSVIQRFRFDPFGAPTVLAPDGTTVVPVFQAVGEPTFAGMSFLPSAGLYVAKSRVYDPRTGEFLARDPFLYRDSSSPYVFVRHNPVDLADPDGEALFTTILVVMAVGSLIGAGISTVRQGIKISEDGQPDGFSGWEVAESAAIGAMAAPATILLPEVMVPVFTGLGLYSGYKEYQADNYATAAFDVATSIIPLKNPASRQAAWGRGTWTGALRGRGPALSWGERVTHFRYLEITARIKYDRFRGRTPLNNERSLFREFSEAGVKSSSKLSQGPGEGGTGLLDTRTGRLRTARNRRRTTLFEEPSLDAGHMISNKQRTRVDGEHRLALEDTLFNMEDAWTGPEGRKAGGWVEDGWAFEIDGVPVEMRTAKLYAGEGQVLHPSVLNGARRSSGWTPKPWHSAYTFDHPGMSRLLPGVSNSLLAQLPWNQPKK